MSFVTKINLSNNTFVKQNINSITRFDGENHFSVPLKDRVLGPDLERVSKKLIESNLSSTFVYDKNTSTYVFDNEIIQEHSALISEYTPYSDDVEINSSYKGIEEYTIKDVVFYNKYTNISFDISFDITDENTEKIIGNSFTYAYYENTAESLDYNGDNVVFKVNGGLESDFVNTLSHYKIVELKDDTVLDINSNVLYLYVSGEITINTQTEIGWNAYFYSDVDLVFNNTEITFINNSVENKYKEIIKISKDKYIVK